VLVVALVAGVGLLLSRGASSSKGAAPSPAAEARSPTAGSADAQPPAPASGQSGASPAWQPPQEQIPIAGCWSGLAAFDKTASLDTFRAALGEAISTRDRHLATYLQERLTELVGGDAGRALQVLAWAEKASQPELGVYMDALKATPAVQDPSVAERLLKMAEDKGAPILNRAAAVDALETQHRLSPSALQRLKALALDVSADSAGWVATRTIGRVMKEEFERTGTYAPYWSELLDISARTEETGVKLLALEMPSYSNPILDGASIDKLSEVMRGDPERDVREMAAFRLAVTEEPQKALEAYRTAFETEHDLCVRWAILRFAVRAAGADALPLVEQFAQKDPRLQQDYVDFKELYATGTVDFARIWQGKKEHHDCIMEEGAPH
jgi:hypothetical protein